MRGWRAWYTDGRTFSSADTDWTDLPDTGVLGVVVYLDPPYRKLVSGGDWYYLDSDHVPATVPTHTEWGRWTDPPAVPEVECKRGAAVTDDRWTAVEQAMMEATRWP